MMKQVKSTANRRVTEWKTHLQTTIDKTLNRSHCRHQSPIQNLEENDPFNCTDLIVPNTAKLVQNEVRKHVQEWEELDTRIVQTDTPSCEKGKTGKGLGSHNRKVHRQYNFDSDGGGCDDEEETDGGSNELTMNGDYGGLNWGWHANRIRLPDFFDYTCKGPPPDSVLPESQNTKRRKVISLEDPTKALDYEAKLWEVFQNVPHESEIEASVSARSQCKNLLQLKQEIFEESADYTRLDAHALARLRRRDRHHWSRMSNNICSDNIDCATVRMEFWRRHVVRCSKNDPNRCEFEFLSTHTLLDVHHTILQCGEDELFKKGTERKANGTTTISNNSNGHVAIKPSSGYFFIEDTFYTAGDVDYVTPILQWLEGNLEAGTSKKPTFKKSRKRYLGIPGIQLKKVRMQDVQLGDVAMKLAHRYVHVYNGDCETAVFFTDISMRMKDEQVKRDEYPLVHDIWTNSTSSLVHGPSLCHGCEHCPAVVLTLEDELTDGGPTPLCAGCYEKLHYTSNGQEMKYNNFHAIPLSILQNLKDLSVSHDMNDALF